MVRDGTDLEVAAVAVQAAARVAAHLTPLTLHRLIQNLRTQDKRDLILLSLILVLAQEVTEKEVAAGKEKT